MIQNIQQFVIKPLIIELQDNKLVLQLHKNNKVRPIISQLNEFIAIVGSFVGN